MSVAKSLILSASLAACATALAIPERRILADVPNIVAPPFTKPQVDGTTIFGGVIPSPAPTLPTSSKPVTAIPPKPTIASSSSKVPTKSSSSVPTKPTANTSTGASTSKPVSSSSTKTSASTSPKTSASTSTKTSAGTSTKTSTSSSTKSSASSSTKTSASTSAKTSSRTSTKTQESSSATTTSSSSDSAVETSTSADETTSSTGTTSVASSTATSGTASPTSTPPSSGGAVAAGSATKALLVQFAVPDGFQVSAAPGTEDATGGFADVLVGAVPAIEQEAGTLAWFGAQVAAADGTATNNFVVFDTFADDASRAAHLAGSVAGSVVAQSSNFVGGLSINPFDILAIKGDAAAQANVTLGLQVQFEAQADKIADVQQFCTDSLALAEAESGTTNWLCGQWPDTNKFLILDSFQDQAGRDAHLNGEIAKNLFALVPDTLGADPIIAQLNVVAASVKASPVPASTQTNIAVPIPAAVPATNSLTDTAKFGLLVPFTAQANTAGAVQTFVQGATGLAAAEPGTLQWFGASAENATAADFFVFDTFATEADREAHLAGKVAAGLFSQIAALSSVDIIPYNILAVKSLNDDAAVASNTAGVTLGLRAFFNATSAATVPQAQQLCTDGLALIEQEQGTLNWICAQIPGTQTFIIIDSFATEDARTAHLNGQFVQTLTNAVGTTIEQPDIVSLAVFAGTTKPEGAVVGGAPADPAQTSDVPSPTTTTGSESISTTTSAGAEETTSLGDATTTSPDAAATTSATDSTTTSSTPTPTSPPTIQMENGEVVTLVNIE